MARVRLSAVIMTSFTLSCFAIYNAFRKNRQFYPTMAYIGRSNLTLAILYFHICVMSIAAVFGAKSLFFGNLRAVEIQHLMERTWYAITETCLAFTVFRDDFSAHFIAMFVVLLIVKCAHWLAEDRVEYAEQTPTLQPRFHRQIRSLICFLLILDICFPILSYRSTSQQGLSVQLVFSFEYAILMISALSIAMKYIMYEVDRHSDYQWEDKGTFLLYSELATNFFRVLVYSCFVIIMIRFYTIPLFIVRPMYISFRSLKKSISDVVQARQAIINLNSMYPDATEEDFTRGSDDRTCIICRDEMRISQVLKKLPCNHIFHRSCLRNWFQRQQTCPTCRTDILHPPSAQQRNQSNNVRPHSDVRSNDASSPSSNVPDQNSSSISDTANRHSSAQTNSWNNTSQSGLSEPRLILPPFLFPPPPLPNVPLAPTDSVEYLRREEQTEQQRLMARIETLRNVRSLLDASFIQLNMYLNMNMDDTALLDRLRDTAMQKSASDSDVPTTNAQGPDGVEERNS